jgi:hypothetical protein
MIVDSEGKPIPPRLIGKPKANPLHLTSSTSYFFKRRDGSFFATDPKNAWQIYNGFNQTIGRQLEQPQYVGRTNGKKYIEAVKAAYPILQEQGKEAFEAKLEEALKNEYKLAKKDKTPPPDFTTIDRNGMPVNLAHYGQR